MPYHIIQTIESGKKTICVVPMNWISESQKEFYWPKKGASKKIKKETPVLKPVEDNWIKCKVDRILTQNPIGKN
jgi:hypothetical protein